MTLPVIPGILKHPSPEMLPDLLLRPEVAYRYTLEAIRVASWPVLKQFPRDVLRLCLDAANVRPGRQAALRFLLF